MNFIDYMNSTDKVPFCILVSWKGNENLTQLKIDDNLKNYYQAASETCVDKPILVVKTTKKRYIFPKMENDNWVNPEDISFSWIKIKCFNEDSSLNCEECEGPIDLDDGFKVAFACVYDFLFWEELLNEEGCVSDLAMKLIDYRYRGYTQES